MTTAAQPFAQGRRPDQLSGTARAGFVDRWIYVFTAASFIAVTFTGFIPDSLGKIAAVQAGQRAPFPLVLHMHAVLMGTFLLLLLTQTVLVATGQTGRHRRLGLAAMALVPAIVVVGFVLVPTTYHSIWNTAQAAPPAAKAALQKTLLGLDDVMLLQIRTGVLFPLIMFIALRARAANPGLHKRLMILAVAMPLPAAFNRIHWIPTTLPASPLSADLYVLLAVAPMFVWDVFRNRGVHAAYWIWLAAWLPFALATDVAWDRPWWHATAHRLMGV